MKILNVTQLTNLKWINLFDVEYENKDGKRGHWNFASRKPLTPFTTQYKSTYPTEADAVVIIPIWKDGRNRKLVLIKEFRIPLNDYEYGFPAGLYNPSESVESVTTRELKEETGLDLTKILYVSPPSVSSAGLSDESVTYVVCECKGTMSTEGNEGTEEITINLLDLEQLSDVRKKNRNISAKALPFMLMFESMKKIAWPKHMITSSET